MVAREYLRLYEAEHHLGQTARLATEIPNYRVRPQQIALSQKIGHAIEAGRPLLAEGPVGVGKTYAYLVPGILHALRTKRRLVVATAGIALQEQIVGYDLPTLQRHLTSFSFALLKGAENYLCNVRAEKAQHDLGAEYRKAWASDAGRYLAGWIERTPDGDKAGLAQPVGSTLWGMVSTKSEECKRADCSQYARCHWQRARESAATADVVVVNHHLLLAHLAVLRLTDGFYHVIPGGYGTLVVDEGHELAETARDFFGWRMSEGSLKSIAYAADSDWITHDLVREAEAFFAQLGAHAASLHYTNRIRRPGEIPFPNALVQALADAKASLTASALKLPKDDPDADHYMRMAAAAANAIAHLTEASTYEDENRLYWIELLPGKQTDDSEGKSKAVLRCAVFDVAPILRYAIFDCTPATIITSATLTTGKTFDYIRRELGVPIDHDEVVVESPFDYRRSCLFMVAPPNFPRHDDPDHARATAAVVSRIALALGGRTLALFSSYKALREAAEAVSRTGLVVLEQRPGEEGEAKSKLVDRFKAAEGRGHVLMGTMSFWTGTDLPGDMCRAVVMDKLCFPSPALPYIDAANARDPQGAFMNVSVPRTVVKFRQGMGRLIRRETDRGILVCLDGRLTRKSYGRNFSDSLPDMNTTDDLDEAIRFAKEGLPDARGVR